MIDAFQKRVRRIEGTRIVRTGDLSVSMSLRWEASGDLTVESREPDADDWRSLFALTRPLIADGDSAGIRTVLNIIDRNLADQELQDASADCRQALKQALNSGAMRLKINGRLFSPIEIIQHALYTDFLHDDLDRVQNDSPVLEAAMMLPFVSTILYDPAITIISIARRVNAILEEAEKRGWRLPQEPRPANLPRIV